MQRVYVCHGLALCWMLWWGGRHSRVKRDRHKMHKSVLDGNKGYENNKAGDMPQLWRGRPEKACLRRGCWSEA